MPDEDRWAFRKQPWWLQWGAYTITILLYPLLAAVERRDREFLAAIRKAQKQGRLSFSVRGAEYLFHDPASPLPEHRLQRTIGFRFLAIFPKRVRWRMGELYKIDPAPVGGLPPFPIAPQLVWLRHVFQVLEERYDRKSRVYLRRIGWAVPHDFVRQNPIRRFRAGSP